MLVLVLVSVVVFKGEKGRRPTTPFRTIITLILYSIYLGVELLVFGAEHGPLLGRQLQVRLEPRFQRPKPEVFVWSVYGVVVPVDDTNDEIKDETEYEDNVREGRKKGKNIVFVVGGGSFFLTSDELNKSARGGRHSV